MLSVWLSHLEIDELVIDEELLVHEIDANGGLVLLGEGVVDVAGIREAGPTA